MKISLLGEKIKHLREDANLSQTKMAKYSKIGVLFPFAFGIREKAECWYYPRRHTLPTGLA
jgi:transcriptional regulator with XRE-family HTH domain